MDLPPSATLRLWSRLNRGQREQPGAVGCRRRRHSQRAWQLIALSCMGLAILTPRPTEAQHSGGERRVGHRLMLPVCTEERRDESDDFATSIAFTPDGRHLLIGCRHGAVELRSVEGRLLVRQQPDNECVQNVRVAPDGSWMASASLATVRRWSRDGQPLGSFGTGAEPIMAMAIAPDGSSLLTGHLDGTANLWRPDGQLITGFGRSRSLGIDGHVVAAAFTPSGDAVVLGLEKGTVVKRALSGQELAAIETGYDILRTMTFAAGGDLLTGGLWNLGLQRWNASGQQIGSLRQESSVSGIAPIDRGRAVVIAGVEVDPYIELHRFNGSAPWRFEPAPSSPEHERLAVSADGKVLAMVDSPYVYLWDLP